MGKYQSFKYDSALPPMHFIDGEDDKIIEDPNEYVEFSHRALAYKGPDKNLFEDEAPRRGAVKRSGHMNSWYNNHRGAGHYEPVHAELNQEFVGKEWADDPALHGGIDKSKVVNQGAYRHRYKYLYPDADPSMPQSGINDYETRDWVHTAANSAYRNAKYFERELESFIRGTAKNDGLRNNNRNVIIHADLGMGNNQGMIRTGSTRVNPNAIREYKAQGAYDAKFARNYNDAMRSNPNDGDWDPNMKAKHTKYTEKFAMSSDINRYTKQALTNDLKSLNRILIKHDTKLADEKSKLLVRSAIEKGEKVLERLRKLKQADGDANRATEKDKLLLTSYNSALSELSKTKQLGKIAKSEGLTNRDYGIYKGRISTRDANHRMAQRQAINEKFAQLSKGAVFGRHAKHEKNANRALRHGTKYDNGYFAGNMKDARFTKRNMNGLKGDPHKRHMDKFTSGLNFNDSSKFMTGRKSSNLVMPEAHRKNTTSMQTLDGDNRGMITNRRSAIQDDHAKYKTGIDLFEAI